MKPLFAITALFAFVAAAVPAADNPVVGTWQCAFSIRAFQPPWYPNYARR